MSTISERHFWHEVEKTPTILRENEPVIIQGKTMFQNPEEGRKEMAISCNSKSQYVDAYLIQPASLRGTVLDLGCGTGVNSVPLLRKGWEVVAIDKEPAVISIYRSWCSSSGISQVGSSSALIHGDITVYVYPNDVDAVICVDVLSYLPPSTLKVTMGKIFQALRPGGKLIGTLFFKRFPEEQHVIFELMGKLGAHFYPGEEFARRIVTISGFQIVNERVRIDEHLPHCLEFLAEKPA